jgi:hypothetical protein
MYYRELRDNLNLKFKYEANQEPSTTDAEQHLVITVQVRPEYNNFFEAVC